MSLGSNQGNTYNGREGVDLAFRLAYQPNLTDVRQSFQRSRAKAEAKKIAKEKGRANLAKWNQNRPDFFWAHDKEMQQRLDDLYDWGSKLMDAGIDDPTTSSNPQAIEFQKEMGKIKAMAKESKAIEDRYNKDRQSILNDRKGVYTEESIDSLFDEYKNIGLEEAIETGWLPSRLKYKEAKIHYTPWVTENAGKISNDAPIENHFEFYKGAIADNPDQKEAILQDISKMSPEEIDSLKEGAKKTYGTDDEDALASYYAGKMSFATKHQKPKDWNKVDQTILDFEVGHIMKKSKVERDIGGGDTETTSSSKKVYPWNNIIGGAKASVNSAPDGYLEKKQGTSYPTYKIGKDGFLIRDKNGSLVFDKEKVVRTKDDLIEMKAMEKAMTLPYESSYGKDLAFDQEWKAYGGWNKVKDDYDIWQKSLQGIYPEGGSSDLKKLNQQRAISWLNGLDIDGYNVTNGNMEYYEAGGVKPMDVYAIEGGLTADFFDGPNRAFLNLERDATTRKDGVKGTTKGPKLRIDMYDTQQANTGLTKSWYARNVKQKKSLFRPATEEDKFSLDNYIFDTGAEKEVKNKKKSW